VPELPPHALEHDDHGFLVETNATPTRGPAYLPASPHSTVTIAQYHARLDAHTHSLTSLFLAKVREIKSRYRRFLGSDAAVATAIDRQVREAVSRAEEDNLRRIDILEARCHDLSREKDGLRGVAEALASEKSSADAQRRDAHAKIDALQRDTEALRAEAARHATRAKIVPQLTEEVAKLRAKVAFLEKVRVFLFFFFKKLFFFFFCFAAKQSIAIPFFQHTFLTYIYICFTLQSGASLPPAPVVDTPLDDEPTEEEGGWRGRCVRMEEQLTDTRVRLKMAESALQRERDSRQLQRKSSRTDADPEADARLLERARLAEAEHVVQMDVLQDRVTTMRTSITRAKMDQVKQNARIVRLREALANMHDSLSTTLKVDSAFLTDLTCPRCLKIYDEPSTLPCGHTYCGKCCTAQALNREYAYCIECEKPVENDHRTSQALDSIALKFFTRQHSMQHLIEVLFDLKAVAQDLLDASITINKTAQAGEEAGAQAAADAEARKTAGTGAGAGDAGAGAGAEPDLAPQGDPESQ
jgi:hypothetical protein